MIRLDETSGIPIYQQVVDGLKREILGGILRPDGRVPSIRELAAELRLNPNTVAKAFAELEAAGFIYFRRGQGAFVAQAGSEDRKREAHADVMRRLTQILAEARTLGISLTKVRCLIHELWTTAASDTPERKEDER